MKAIFLIRDGTPEKAFEIREADIPKIEDDEILIRNEGFGLNFADIVAREGMYRDAPPKPCVLGYDVVGTVTECGSKVKDLKNGDRVTALTRFGGYAEFTSTPALAAVKIPIEISISVASALTTQYCTAYYCAAIAANLKAGERVIIHTASGGVGNALLQYAKYLNCEIIATTSSASKILLLKEQGVNHVINISNEDFFKSVKKIYGKDGIDVVFDAVGGKFVNQGIRLLAPAGRIVCYGASLMTGTNLFSRIRIALQFGIYHPAQFMMSSRSLIGVNILRIAEERPKIIHECLKQVMKLFNEGILVPTEGKIFKASEIAAAHRYLQEKKATGKVAVSWD